MSSEPLHYRGDRRSGYERRQFTYLIHVPERRSGMDRRSGKDRRSQRYSYRGDKDRRQILK